MSHTPEYNHAEYAAIRKDLRKLFVINIIFLGLLIGLYFWNRESQVLEHILAKYLNW